MFDWLFQPSCPRDRAAKAWIEDRPARASLKQGIRYLRASGDTWYKPRS